MARCGHARPRAPRRAGGRLPRGPRRARPARRRSGPGPAARRRRPGARCRGRRGAVRGLLAAIDAVPATDAVADDDARALGAMRAGIETAFGPDAELPVAPPIERASCDDAAAWAAAIEAGGTPLRERLEGCYGTLADDLEVDGERLARPQILGRLGDRAGRGEAATPVPGASSRCGGRSMATVADRRAGRDIGHRRTRRCSAESRARWARRRLPHRRQRAALGLAEGDVERWAVAALEAWRDAVDDPARARGEPAVEPWDWWWRAGEADRAVRGHAPARARDRRQPPVVRRPGRRLRCAGRDVRHDAAAGPADRLGRVHDVRRATAPPASTAPGRPGAPVVLATYVDGGLGDLAELVHEGGHACPHRGDPDAARLRRLARLGRAHRGAGGGRRARRRRARLAGPLDPRGGARCRTRPRSAAATPRSMLDTAWALFEIRLHAEPDRTPERGLDRDHVDYLGIAPHPEWSWWAMRGQLVQEPGYMANYSVGAVLAADLRAAIRAARGDWTGGDPGWYGVGLASTSTGSGRNAPPATCCATSSDAHRTSARCSRRSTGPAADEAARTRSRRPCG